MLEKINFNTLINHVTFTMDNLLKDKKYPEELLEYLYLIVTGMIINYGDEAIDEIYDMIENINIVSSTKIKDYSNSSNLSYVNPTEHNYLGKSIDVSSGFPSIKLNFELLYSKIDSSNIKTLEYLTHELNYVLFNKNRKFNLVDSIKMRYDYLRNNLEYQDDEVSTINKVFNVLQAEDIVKTILILRDYDIKNTKFKKALSRFDNIDVDIYKFEGRDLLTNLFRPLYNVPKVKELVNKNNFLDEDAIAREFDDVLGKNSYKDTCKKLDYLDNMIASERHHKDTSYFALSVEYISIRNDFVNKYLVRTCLMEN